MAYLPGSGCWVALWGASGLALFLPRFIDFAFSAIKWAGNKHKQAGRLKRRVMHHVKLSPAPIQQTIVITQSTKCSPQISMAQTSLGANAILRAGQAWQGSVICSTPLPPLRLRVGVLASNLQAAFREPVDSSQMFDPRPTALASTMRTHAHACVQHANLHGRLKLVHQLVCGLGKCGGSALPLQGVLQAKRGGAAGS